MAVFKNTMFQIIDTGATSLDTRDITNLKKSLYVEKRKTEPAVAQEEHAAVQQMREMSEKEFTHTSEKFIHVVDDLVLFTCASNLT